MSQKLTKLKIKSDFFKFLSFLPLFHSNLYFYGFYHCSFLSLGPKEAFRPKKWKNSILASAPHVRSAIRLIVFWVAWVPENNIFPYISNLVHQISTKHSGSIVGMKRK